MKELYGKHPLFTHTRAYKSGGGDAPKPLNYTTLLNQTLQGYQDTARGFYDLNSQYQPLYQQLGLQNLTTQLGGYTAADGTYHPGTVGLDQATNTSNRLANTGDLAAISPGITDSILGNNPFLSYGLNSLASATDQAGQGSPLLGALNQRATSGSPILGTLQSQAQQQLAQQGALSPEQQRNVDQSALGLFSNSGNAQGNSAIAAQLYARDAATTARQQAAQQFAGSVEGLTQAQNQFGLGVQGANQAQTGLYGNLSSNLAGTASSALTNPILQILGLGNLTPGAIGGGSSGASSAIGNANSLFDPNSSLSGDIAGANFNAANAQYISGQNNDAAMWAAIIQAAGSALSDDRIKKSVRETGEETSEGIPIVSWIYRTDPNKRRWKGVMASEVAKVRPDAVLTDPISGLRAVNYGKLGVPLSIHEQLLTKEAA